MTKYLAGRNIDINDVIDDPDKMDKLGGEFLNDVYPGMLKTPNELIKLMTAEDADKAVANMALNPPADPCDKALETIEENTTASTTTSAPQLNGGKQVKPFFTKGLLCNACSRCNASKVENMTTMYATA